MKRYTLFYILVILLFSCSQNLDGNFNNKKGYYEIRGSNGIPEVIKYYTEDGVLNGGAITFMESGNVRSFTYLTKDSIVLGPSVRYYDNGTINYFTSFIEGKQEGISVHYSPMGILTKKLYYRNGLMDGKQYIFDYDSGDTLKIELYDKGELIQTFNSK